MDWDWHKKNYINYVTSGAESWMKRLEEEYSSPIERITFMSLVLLSNQCFDDFELEIVPQYEIGKYKVDFLVCHYKTDTYIVIECDGHNFHEKTKKQAAHDKTRDRFITKQGYTILRYTGSQICENPQEISDDVHSIIKERKSLQKKRGS